VLRADNLTTFMCRLSLNLGASTSWNPQGLSRPVMGLLYLYRLYVLSSVQYNGIDDVPHIPAVRGRCGPQGRPQTSRILKLCYRNFRTGFRSSVTRQYSESLMRCNNSNIITFFSKLRLTLILLTWRIW